MMGNNKVSKDLYEVYACKYNDEYVYIGSGKHGRHRHCTSGCSHVYELNQMHFDGTMNDMVVEILYQTLDKALSLEKETELIRLYRPKFNKVHVTSERNMLAQDSLKVRKRFKQTKYLRRLNSDSALSNYDSLVNEFVNYFGYTNILDKNIKLRSVSDYDKVNLKHIKLLTHYLRYSRIDSLKDNNACKVLYDCLLECFNIDLRYCI